MTQQNQIAAILRGLQGRTEKQDQLISQIFEILQANANTPRWIEQIPGRRSNYWGAINLTLAASSTAAVSGTLTVTTDGPFIVTALLAFYRKTSGAYQGSWGGVSSFDARIITASQQHGHQFLFDQPHITDGTFEFLVQGSDRNWQDNALSSAIFSPQAGGAYVLPVANLLERGDVFTAKFTPLVSQPHSGSLQVIVGGYKIVQGNTYAP